MFLSENPSMPEINLKLQKILLEWIQNCQQDWKDNLVAAIHFGSTSSPNIKIETDVDLLLVFKTLPDSKWERFQWMNAYETQLENSLKTLTPYQLTPSVMAWKESSFVQFHTLYLDFVTTSHILFEKDQIATQVIQKTKKWLDDVGAVKHQKGNLWYWDVNPQKKKQFKWGY
jgi:hypothetical protein